MVFSVTEFLKSPTVDEFESLKKDDLIGLGLHLKLDVKSSMRKQEIRNIVAKELLAKEIFSSYDFPVEPVSSETKMSKYEFELEKMKIQLQFEKEEKERQFQIEKEEKERQFEKEEKERHLQFEREKEEREKQERMHEKELQFELEKLKLEKSAKENPVPSPLKSEFDAAKNIRLVPKFQEKSVDKYFPHFEKIAANLKWPRDFWPTLLQSVLIGKAAEVYSALSIAESSDYDKVKDTILRAYQLVPEAYSQKFRKYKKFENQTYVEFAREKEDLFDQWFRSKKIPNSFDNLRQIILIEEFKECVHQDLRTHLEDKNVKTLEEAAVLSDTYALTHKKNFVSKTQSSDSAKTSDFPKKNLQESQSSISSQSPSQGGSTSGPRSERSEASPGLVAGLNPHFFGQHLWKRSLRKRFSFPRMKVCRFFVEPSCRDLETDGISFRCLKFTYGVETTPPFNKTVHPIDKKVEYEGKELCANVFHKYVQAGTIVKVGDSFKQRFYPIRREQRMVKSKLYSSLQPNTQFTTDSDCKLIGEIVIELPKFDDRNRALDLELFFGDTELKIEVHEVETGNKVQSHFEFLE
ncbi:hypothetical protein FSP39_006484 [Pinctada imbricata]|uniref:SCAN box domain-containing protein n=1 Tax=Pinctada imbricata TaxID=66713 RepID=A0AA88XSR6_PINIB|nr:hypothetical protein FSP39_006484 [Pinctada imbricata]